MGEQPSTRAPGYLPLAGSLLGHATALFHLLRAQGRRAPDASAGIPGPLQAHCGTRRRQSPRSSGPATAGPSATWPPTWRRSWHEPTLHQYTFEHFRPILEQNTGWTTYTAARPGKPSMTGPTTIHYAWSSEAACSGLAMLAATTCPPGTYHRIQFTHRRKRGTNTCRNSQVQNFARDLAAGCCLAPVRGAFRLRRSVPDGHPANDASPASGNLAGPSPIFASHSEGSTLGQRPDRLAPGHPRRHGVIDPRKQCFCS